MNSTFNLKHESRKIKQSCAGRWAGVKPRCFARVSAPHSPWQTFLNNKQKRGSGQGPHATTKETATTGRLAAHAGIRAARLPSTPLHPIPHNGGIGMGGGGRNPRRITEPAVQSETAAEVQRRLCHRPQRAHYGSCRCRDDRQWQADTVAAVASRHRAARSERAPRRSQRDGSSNERFPVGGRGERPQQGIRPPNTPRNNFIILSPLTTKPPNHSFDITFTSREPHRIFYLMIIMVTRAGGWGRCLDGFKEPSSCGLSVTQQSERETTVKRERE